MEMRLGGIQLMLQSDTKVPRPINGVTSALITWLCKFDGMTVGDLVESSIEHLENGPVEFRSPRWRVLLPTRDNERVRWKLKITPRPQNDVP